MTIEAPDTVPIAALQRALEQQLDERLSAIQEVQQFASASVDPVAYQATASHRVAVDQITAALNRISAGTYGRCVGCGNQIATARLEVLPYAAACIECQSNAEAA